MGSLDKRPSKIPQSQGYKGVGKNPDSKIKQSNGYSGVGKSPEAKLNDQIKRIDKALADEAKKRGDEPPPSISPRGSEMTMEQKMEAVRTARSSWNERNIEELSARPSAPPAEQPSVAPSKQQFAITTDVTEEKPERPELVSSTPVVEPAEEEEEILIHPFKVTSSFDSDTDAWLYEVYEGVAGGIPIPTTDPKLTVTDEYFIYVTFTRDTSSREVTYAILENGSEVPESTESYQYVAIAKVDAGEVVQHRFEDIRVTEILISEAGELKLISVFDTTNSYALP
jgi:hypothetical protein